MRWRPLRKNELDHELIWLFVSLAAFACVYLWFHLKLRTPSCAFHELTGWPCPACGSTRCLRHLLAARWNAALQINPLAALTMAATLIFDLYAATVLLFRLPRLRWDFMTAQTARLLRIATLTLLALNWAWLIRQGV